MLGPNTVVEAGAQVKRSVTMSQVYVGQAAGVRAAVVRVFNLESSPLPLTRHAVATLGAQGGVFVAAGR